jgi:hypothetical protein
MLQNTKGEKTKQQRNKGEDVEEDAEPSLERESL